MYITKIKWINKYVYIYIGIYICTLRTKYLTTHLLGSFTPSSARRPDRRVSAARKLWKAHPPEQPAVVPPELVHFCWPAWIKSFDGGWPIRFQKIENIDHIYIYMYVCMYVCIYICMYVYVCICECRVPHPGLHIGCSAFLLTLSSLRSLRFTACMNDLDNGSDFTLVKNQKNINESWILHFIRRTIVVPG